MWSIICEIFTYLCFLTLLYIITYSNLNSNAFDQVKHLRKFILNSREIDQDFTKIVTVNEYWSWLEETFLDNIYKREGYYGDPPWNLTDYINDKTNRLLGWITMRQLRVQSHPCQIQQSYFSRCQDDYSWFNEEKRSFAPGWLLTNQTIQVSNSSTEQAFKYRTDDEFDSYVYIGEHGTYRSGGYVYEFRGQFEDIRKNLSLLHRFKWIDNQTRAVIIQFNLYNPNVDLFSSVTLLMEFLTTGGLYPQYRIEPLSFQIFNSLTFFICSILYLLFILYLIIEQIRLLMQLKLKYFYHFWSYIDLSIIICSLTSIGIYVWRYFEAQRLSKLLQKTNGHVYINLQLLICINDILINLIAFCCFFGTIKSLRFCRLNQRLLLFIKTLHHCKKDLLGFLFLFSILFFAFTCLFYLLFNSKLFSCSSLLRTSEMLLSMILRKFNARDLIDTSSVVGPIAVSLFIFLVVFVCLSMFIAIINHSYRSVRKNYSYQNTEHIFAFIYRKFRYWIAMSMMYLGRSSEFERMIKRDEEIRGKYYDPIERFPDKIDQLLNALDRIYIDQQRSLSKKSDKKVYLSFVGNDEIN